MDRKNYLPRIVDRQLQEYLKTFGAVCVEGPKWCGKAWTSSFHSKSEIFIGDPWSQLATGIKYPIMVAGHSGITDFKITSCFQQDHKYQYLSHVRYCELHSYMRNTN